MSLCVPRPNQSFRSDLRRIFLCSATYWAYAVRALIITDVVVTYSCSMAMVPLISTYLKMMLLTSLAYLLQLFHILTGTFPLFLQLQAFRFRGSCIQSRQPLRLGPCWGMVLVFSASAGISEHVISRILTCLEFGHRLAVKLLERPHTAPPLPTRSSNNLSPCTETWYRPILAHSSARCTNAAFFSRAAGIGWRCRTPVLRLTPLYPTPLNQLLQWGAGSWGGHDSSLFCSAVSQGGERPG